MNSVSEIGKLRLPALLLGVAAALLTVFSVALTGYTVYWYSDQQQGHMRALVIGLSFSSIFGLYAYQCFNAYTAPSLDKFRRIFIIQAMLFVSATILICIAIF